MSVQARCLVDCTSEGVYGIFSRIGSSTKENLGVQDDPGLERLSNEFFSGSTVFVHMIVRTPFSGSENGGLNRKFSGLKAGDLQPSIPG